MNYTRESWRMNRPLTPPIAQPCGYVSTSGEVCQKPRARGLGGHLGAACVDHAIAVRTLKAREEAKRTKERGKRRKEREL